MRDSPQALFRSATATSRARNSGQREQGRMLCVRPCGPENLRQTARRYRATPDETRGGGMMVRMLDGKNRLPEC